MPSPVTASVSRHCMFYKAQNGKWYLELADREHGEQDDSTTYGPFPNQDKAEDFLDNFSNPGSSWVDDSGELPVPNRSPNGGRVVNPSTYSSFGGGSRGRRWSSALGVASRYLKRSASESQKDLQWGIQKLNKSLDDIEEVLIHWAPSGRSPGLADDHPGVAEAVSVMRQVGQILGPQITKLKRLKIGSRGKPLDRKTKNLVAGAFRFEGLDGNKSFRSAQKGYAKAVEVLQDYGIELDDIVSSHLFNRPEGRFTLHIAFTNEEDRFSPIPISNSMLVVTFYKKDTDKFEVIAYLS